jgi:hypothetical protein
MSERDAVPARRRGPSRPRRPLGRGAARLPDARAGAEVAFLRSFMTVVGLTHATPAPYREGHGPSSPCRRSVACCQRIALRRHTSGATYAHALRDTPGTGSVACLQASCHVAQYLCLGRRDSAVLALSSWLAITGWCCSTRIPL